MFETHEWNKETRAKRREMRKLKIHLANESNEWSGA
jgi:hypothetical protein